MRLKSFSRQLLRYGLDNFIFLLLACMLMFAFNRFCFAEEKIQTTKHIFYNAANLYEESKYDEAIKEYSKLLERGLESGNLYYNLGNCYFKKGEVGFAILNYERAKKLIPRDRDLKANYRHAKSLITGNSRRVRKILPLRLIYKFSEQFAIDDLTVCLFSMYFVAVIIIVVGVIFKMNKKYFLTLLSVLIIGFALGTFSFYSKVSLLDKEAIVVKEAVNAKFEPFDKATTHFTLYEGMKVCVLSSREEWCKIERHDGKAGWIKKSALELI